MCFHLVKFYFTSEIPIKWITQIDLYFNPRQLLFRNTGDICIPLPNVSQSLNCNLKYIKHLYRCWVQVSCVSFAVRSLDLLFYEQLLRRAICRSPSLTDWISVTLNLNIYYYCSVSRTSLPILTAIISTRVRGWGHKASSFYLTNALFVHISKRFDCTLFFLCPLLSDW